MYILNMKLTIQANLPTQTCTCINKLTWHWNKHHHYRHWTHHIVHQRPARRQTQTRPWTWELKMRSQQILIISNYTNLLTTPYQPTALKLVTKVFSALYQFYLDRLHFLLNHYLVGAIWSLNSELAAYSRCCSTDNMWYSYLYKVSAHTILLSHCHSSLERTVLLPPPLCQADNSRVSLDVTLLPITFSVRLTTAEFGCSIYCPSPLVSGS